MLCKIFRVLNLRFFPTLWTVPTFALGNLCPFCYPVFAQFFNRILQFLRSFILVVLSVYQCFIHQISDISGLFLDIFSYFFLINSLQESIKVLCVCFSIFLAFFGVGFGLFVVLGYLSGRDLFSLMICLSHSIFLKS